MNINEINFLPESYLRKQARRRRVVHRTFAVVCLSLVLAGWWFVQAGRADAMRHDAEALERQVAVATEQHAEIIELRNQYVALSNQLRVHRELAQPVSHTQVLATLGRLLPSTVAVTDIEMVTKRPPPRELNDTTVPGRHGGAMYDPPPPNRINIEFEGFAPDDLTVANLVAELGRCPLFERVRLHSSRSAQRFGYLGRKFKLTTEAPLDREYRPTAAKELADVR